MHMMPRTSMFHKLSI